MKHLFLSALIVSGLVFTACAPEKNTAEKAAENYFKEALVLHKTIKTKTNDLNVNVLEADENTAIIEVSASLDVCTKLKAVKDAKGKWVIQE